MTPADAGAELERGAVDPDFADEGDDVVGVELPGAPMTPLYPWMLELQTPAYLLAHIAHGITTALVLRSTDPGSAHADWETGEAR